MAAIVAADVTNTVLYRFRLGRSQNNQNPLIGVACDILIDPGSTDTYPTGGVPLDVMFTAGTVNDTGLDVTQPIVEMSPGGFARISDALAPSTAARFYNGGVTPATQTLVIYTQVKDDGTKSDSLIEYPAEDITTNTTVTTPLATGDKDIRYRTILIGRKRPNFDASDLDV